MNNAYVESPQVQPHLSGAYLMVARVMLRDGYEPGMGLGQNGDGTTSLVKFIENRGRFDLGYEPTHANCHTLISSGYHCLMACNLCLTASRYLAPFVSQYVKFRDMSGIKRKHCYTIREFPLHARNQKEALLCNP